MTKKPQEADRGRRSQGCSGCLARVTPDSDRRKEGCVGERKGASERWAVMGHSGRRSMSVLVQVFWRLVSRPGEVRVQIPSGLRRTQAPLPPWPPVHWRLSWKDWSHFDFLSQGICQNSSNCTPKVVRVFNIKFSKKLICKSRSYKKQRT